MKFPRGLPNGLVLRTWMDQGKGRDSNMQSASFVSPMWKQQNATDEYPRVVTLSLRPFRTTNLSLDSFMASHSPRRNCGNKQKFMLKPLDLDQRNCSTNIHSTFGKDPLGLSVTSSSRVHEGVTQDKQTKPDRPQSNCSQGRERKESPSVITLADYDSLPRQCVPDSLYTFRNNSFRPSPKLSQATGQKIALGNSFGFNSGYLNHPGYLNLLQQQTTGLIATGMPIGTITNQRQTQTKPTSRLQSKSIANDKGSKYPDPMLGASPNFQARISEIVQHELDTVKWEKAKKGKKKNLSSS